MSKKILVVTNMYPTKKTPAAGIFVKKMTQQLEDSEAFCIGLWVIPNISNKFIAYFLFYAFFIFKLLTFRPHIVYCHFVSHTGLLGVLAKKLLGCKLIFNCHGSDVMNSIDGHKLKYKLNSYLFDYADKIIVPSFFLQSIVQDKFTVSNEKLFIYPSGGVFIPEPKPAEKIKIGEHKLNGGILKIGYVGRLTEFKGIKILKEALSKVDNVELLVAGGGDISLLENNLNPKVKLTYLGEQPQQALRHIYEQIDLLVFPTLLQESLGLTPIEAMAYYVPVIGSDIGAVSEYIINNETGFLVTPTSVDKLESALVDFTQMSLEQIFKLKVSARAMAENYDEKIIVFSLVEMIKQLD